MTTVQADSVRQELVDRLSGLSAGDVSVKFVEVSDDFWPDDEDRNIRVVVHLSDPVGDTWSLEDTDVLRAATLDALSDLGILSRVRFRFAGGRPPGDAALGHTVPVDE